MADTSTRSVWSWILTVLALFAAIATYVYAPDMSTRSQIGDFLSGFASAIAFIWLVAAYAQQGNELRLQRHELALQRQSLDLQREELKKMGKYAGLEQVARLLEQFNHSLSLKPAGAPRSTGELPAAFTQGMELWKTILESHDANAVLGAYTKWMPIESACSEFLSRIASAVDLYCEAAGVPPIRPDLPPAERIYFGYEDMKGIPHASNYIGAAYGVATSLVLLSPGLDLLKLAGWEATEKLFPGVVKEDALNDLKAKVKARDDALKAKKVENAIQSNAPSDAQRR